MDSSRWDKIQEIFHAALELSDDKQEEFIRSEAGDDEELIREVLDLIESDREEDGLLDSSVGLLLDLAPAAAEGKVIGPYRIVRQVGSGGMGAVYLAERADGHFSQNVALKIIKRGMDTDEILSRFSNERQILAGLNHPNVSRLLDGGVTDDGLPWFSMEYIDGVPITDYCDDNNLSIRERLELFRTVCRTVEYAQNNLVVHRDLKPSNILITSDKTVKLLDFGIAKVIGETADSPAQSNLTRTGLRVMTPRYASPEQIRGESVSMATDVYSLGVVMYQLLTGESPYRDDLPPHELERAILDDNPTKPSSRFATSRRLTDTQRIKLHAEYRASQPNRLRKLLSGDLDTITTTALAKSVERRYQSVGEFGRDIQRYLAGRPITARAESFAYRTGKFLLRNRLPVAALAVVLIAIVSLVSYYTVKVSNERDRARLEADKAAQVAGFLTELFESADPNQTGGETVTVLQVLNNGVLKVEEDLHGQPELQAEMLGTLGHVYHQLGNYAQADTLFTRALDIRQRLFDPPDEQIASSLHQLAVLMHDEGDMDSAEVLYSANLDMCRELYKEPTEELGSALTDYGALLKNLQEYDRAETLLTEGLAVRRAVFGDESADVAHTLNHLGRIYYYRGEYERAEPLNREALEIRRKLLGNYHVETIASMGSLGGLLALEGKLDESSQLYTEALAAIMKLYGKHHPYVAGITSSLAHVRMLMDDYQAAESLYTQSKEIFDSTLTPGHLSFASVYLGLASCMIHGEQLDSAEVLQRRAVEINMDAYPPGVWQIEAARSALGDCLARQGRYEEAEPLLLESFKAMQGGFGDGHRNTKIAGKRVYEYYSKRGLHGLAAPFEQYTDEEASNDENQDLEAGT